MFRAQTPINRGEINLFRKGGGGGGSGKEGERMQNYAHGFLMILFSSQVVGLLKYRI